MRYRIILILITVIFILAAMPVISAAQSCAPAPSGMVGWWPGNGNATDLVNGNNGTLINGVTYAPGSVGQAFSFNQANQQYVDVPSTASYLLNNNAGTIAAWVNPSSVGDNDMIVAFGTGNNGEGVGIGIYGNVRIYHHTLPFDWQTNTPVSANTWTYLVYTWDGSTETLYKNGVFAESRARNFNYVPANSRIGYGFWNDPANFFPGLIDEVAIFNRKLEAGEVSAIYNAGSAGVCPNCAPTPANMVSLWAGENTPLDSLGRNNATLRNSTTYAPGIKGQAFSFDGVDDYIEIPDSASLGLTGGLTLGAWVKQRSAGFGTIFSKADDNGSEPISSYGLQINPAGAINVALYGTYPADNWTTGPGLVTVGQWNHIALTWDGTYGPADNVKLYINGSLVQSWTKSGTPLNVTSQTLTLGSMKPPTYYGHLDGLIDEPAIFSRALSGTEITAIYNAAGAGFCGTCTPAPVGLVSWWTADGAASDIRGFNNGIAEGNITFTSGNVAQAFNFDGSSDIRIPASSSLDVGFGGGMTIDMWVKPTTVSPAPLAEWSPPAPGAHFWIGGGGNAGNLYINLKDPGGNDHVMQSAGGVVVPNEWQHVAMTYDRASGIAVIYRNGSIVAGPTNLGSFTPSTSSDLYLGLRVSPVYLYSGVMDEVGIYDRALTPAEIQAIANAGSAGKCKPTATISPSGLVAWWGGDGDARDQTQYGHDGVQAYGPSYSFGRVGQAFNFDGVSGHYIEVAGNGPPFDPGAGEFSVDLWINSKDAGANSYLIGKSHPNSGQGWDIRLNNNMIRLVGVNGWGFNLDSDASVTPNTWHHIAMSSTTATVSLYIDGVLKGTCPRSSIGTTANPMRFGHTTDYGGAAFDGLMDEIDLFDRAITPAEIASIYNAGLAGKLKEAATLPAPMINSRRANTEAGTITTVNVGDAAVSFPFITTGGVTQQIPLDSAKLPPLPMGATPTNLTYDIATSAIWSGDPSVCFNLPALSAVYTNLRILHLENGVWVNRTQIGGVNPILCTDGLASLSPFTIVAFGPTAANVSMSGRVLTNDGRGIRNAIVAMTDLNGITRTALSSSFGYYRFEDVIAGQSYVMDVRSKSFHFAPRVVQVTDNVSDMDLVANSPPSGRR